ncbi:hypothetical protein P6709_19520 [Jeotgalibacillus sp. ET6]|uniref:hypothetical protein n=1 Tax=Jeotgalibacillus sp. ET6 TaxID=3037260 RepID=UPI0024182AEB|nr:hypothetical protein [Jeotgalibacillus sp. ET6]MDG5473920.1 hypothetical protein [Jeotgalibacillus sp. ET6]
MVVKKGTFDREKFVEHINKKSRPDPSSDIYKELPEPDIDNHVFKEIKRIVDKHS